LEKHKFPRLSSLIALRRQGTGRLLPAMAMRHVSRLGVQVTFDLQTIVG
jgi:hypothetical protein